MPTDDVSLVDRHISHSTHTVGELRQLLRSLAAGLDRYDYKAEVVEVGTAARLYETLQDGQWLVPEVEVWCVGYTYNPKGSFRPGVFADFYGCLTEQQAEAVLAVFARKHAAMYALRGYPSKDICEVKKVRTRVWNVVRPDADPEDVCTGVFNGR